MQFEIINKNLFFIPSNGNKVSKSELFGKAKEFAGELWLEPTIGSSTDGKSLMLRFGQEAYPRGEAAAPAVGRRWVTLVSIYKALNELGIQATLQDSRVQKGEGDVASSTYVPACAIFVNQEARSKAQGQTQGQTRVSDEDLLVAAIAVDEGRAMAIVGESTEFNMAQRARLRMLVERGTQAKPTETKAEATETKTESDTSTSESTESHDSEAIPF
jgi:hypothetical protein